MSEQRKEMIDLMVLGDKVVTMDDDWTVLDDGAIAIEEGRILAVGPKSELKSKYTPKETLGLNGQVVMPGLVNAHTHAATCLFRGLADDRPLKEWLERFIWPAEAEFIDPETVHWGTLLAICEMVRGGITSILDMYFHTDIVAKAAKQVGFRAVLGEVIFDFAGPNKLSFDEGLDFTRDLFEEYRLDPLVSFSLQPHSTYTVSADNLLRAKGLADQFGALFAIHASETEFEVKDVFEKTGFSPVRLLNHLGLLDGNVALFHGVHFDDEEISILAETQTGVVHCPESNLKLASGIARVPELLKAGVPMGLGTDGAASNNDLDLWGEIQLATKLHMGVHHDPLAVNACQAIYMATRGGASILGMGDIIGSLEPGKRADLITIDFNQAHLVPMYDVYSHLAYAVGRADVISTVVNGVVLMRDRDLITIDENEVIAQVNRIGYEINTWRKDQIAARD